MKAPWAARALNIIAILLVGFLLTAPHAASGQNASISDTEDVTALSQQVTELSKQGRYSDAIPLAQRMLAIQETKLGPQHPDVALALYNLAEVYFKVGRYSDAEPLYNRSLAIDEKALGPDHPDVATSLSNLALLYEAQGRYSDAEPLYNRSLAIQEKALGPDHPYVANLLNNLASLYVAQGRYADAEPLYKRALAIRENALGPDHPDVARSLHNLAGLSQAQGRLTDAEPLLRRSLTIIEKALGPDHPDVAQPLHNLAGLYQNQGRYADAEPLYKRSLAIQEKALGPDHPYVAALLNNLASLYVAQGRYADAEPLYKRTLAIQEKAVGPAHPDVAAVLNSFASLYVAQGRYAEAEPLLKRTLAIRENALGPDHPDVAELLNKFAQLFRIQGRYAEAEPLYKRSLAIQEKALGPDHPDVAHTLNGLADAFLNQGRYAEAEPLLKRALAIRENALSLDHPVVAATLNDLALLYQIQGRYAEAEPLLKRALAIRENALGPDHPHVASSLTNLAGVYLTEGRYAEAEPLLKRALAIQEKAVGPAHPDVAAVLNSFASLYVAQGRYAEAEPLLKRTLAIRENALGPDHPDVARSLNYLARAYVYEGRYADALPLVRAAAQMRFEQKSVYLAVLAGAVRNLLITNTDASNEGYQVVQRATSTAASKAINQLAARFAAGDDQLAQLVRKDQDLSLENERLDTFIMEAASKEPSKRDAANEQQIKDRLKAIVSMRVENEQALYQQFPNYASFAKPKPLSAQETQKLLADDEALIVIDFDQQSYAWVFTRSNAVGFELKITAQDVGAQAKTLRASIKYAPQFDVGASYALYKSIFDPVAEYIASKKRISVVTNGALTSLPLQLLVTSDPAGKKLEDVDWLVSKYAITVLPSTASLKILRQGRVTMTAAKPMIGFGDPVFDRTVQTATKPKVASFDRSLPEFYRGVIADTKSLGEALTPLPEAADELRAVAKDLGARSEDIKLGEAASVWNVKHARLDDYRIIYFATHALVAGDVEKFAKVKAEPSLVLSIPEKPTEEDDGLLRASDVAMLKMNADFVVLSACNTAAGDKPGAEALSGLARAFIYAGARSLIVSNWEVDSESTVALMTGLFDALKRDPHLSHAEALRLSMLKMINNPAKPEWAQPKFWAPFIVVGEPAKY